MSWLPWHVDPCECGASRFEAILEADGLATTYLCGDCGDHLADLICGAEP